MLVIALHCYCGDNVMHSILSKSLFEWKQQHCGWEYLRVIIKFYKQQWFLVMTWNKKHSSKQTVSIANTLEK